MPGRRAGSVFANTYNAESPKQGSKRFSSITASVADPERFDEDPDPTFYIYGDRFTRSNWSLTI